MAGEASYSVWAAVTKYHNLGSLTKKNLFLTTLEAGKSNLKAQADSMSGESLLPGSWTVIMLLCPGEGVEGALWGLFYKITKRICEGSAS